MRNALDDAAPLYRNAPETLELRQAGARITGAFIEEVLPDVPDSQQILVADITMMCLKSVGKQLSET